MKKLLLSLAAILSCTAILLAMDLGRLRFKYVDVGGHELRMLVSGHESPAVVFEAGGSGAAGGPLEAWERVQPAVSEFTTTVAYDRAGIGRSSPGPKPRDARQIARELHSALHNARVMPPYILVGHSFGGPLNRVFAGMYPHEVAGMVLLDPTQEEFIEWNEARDTKHEERSDEEWKDIQASLTEAHQSRVPPGVPVILITGMKHHRHPGVVSEEEKEELNIIKPMWLKFHDEWVKTIPGARHIVTENSGHGIPFEEPDLVIKTIRHIVSQTRLPHVPREVNVPGR